MKELKPKTDKIIPAKPKAAKYYAAVGRRKTAICRARLLVGGHGKITINGRPVEKYFPGAVYQKIYLEPLRTTNCLSRFDVEAIIEGSGLTGQLGAFVHAVSRALCLADKEKFRVILKKQGFLTRDARAKERRKAGLAGKARKEKQSPKR